MSTELLLTFVRNRATKDLVVPITTGTGADVHRAAQRLYGGQPSQTLVIERSGVTIEENSDLAEIQLLTGDRVLVGSDARTAGTPGPAAPRHRLLFLEGPRAGETVELEQGETRVCRGQDRAGVIGIPDDTVSKQHAQLYVGVDSVEIEDRGSRNGTDLNDSAITIRTAVASGDCVRFGDSTGRFELAEALGARQHLARSGGRVAFNREPRVVSSDPATSFDLLEIPATPQKRRFPLPAAILPFITGLVMFYVIGNPIFLIVTAMAPVMVIWTTIDDRRSGRGKFRTDSAEFRQRLADTESELLAVQETRAQWLADKFPRTGTLADRATAHDRRLWRRRPNNDDFLSIRIGTGPLPSASSLKLATTGDAELIGEAQAVKDAYQLEPSVPIQLSLIDHPVIGIVRDDGGVSDLVRAVVAQIVCDQSPRDAALAVLAPQFGPDWEWAKWLPHVTSLGDDLRLVAAGDDQAKALFQGLKGLVDQRLKDADESIGSGRSRFSPHVVVVFHPPAKISRREVTEFLERAPGAGMSILWLASDTTALPGECTAVIDAGDLVSVTFTASGLQLACDSAENLGAQRVTELARSLAPLDDVSSGADSVIPTRIDLLELLACTDVEPGHVSAAWAAPPRGLQAVIGADADGAVRIDWRTDGPHALVAGTTGAGKSELLQSLVASMAFLYPPDDVTFVLIDYKGGSAFKDCEALPHTVGMVTDLDDHLATRALISLGAELHHRERLLNTVGAKDIIEMKEKAPDRAPPNLLIIIDEFAALKNEVPEFVDGVVDIAQRVGEAWVFTSSATQQPNGVIDPKIQGNTNLRIALRVADASDSNDVIGRRDAHEISKSLPGRGYVRTGPTEIDEFQSAYVGGKGSAAVDLDAKTFNYGMIDVAELVKGVGESSAESVTDLQRLVAAVQDAHESSGRRRPRLPWVDALASEVDYADLVSAKPPPMGAVIGVADYPEEQTQRPYVLDFSQHSNHVIYGASGAGKTTLLRTFITDLAIRNSPDRLWVYVLDYASQGLTAIRSLPHCGGVIGADDLNRARRLLEMLVVLVNVRRQSLSEHSAANPDEYESITGGSMPRVLVAIDGFGQLWQTLDGVDRSVHLATLTSLISEGRGVGLHFVLTADTRRSVTPIVTSSVGGRLMLRMSEPDEYMSFGLRHLVNSSPPTNGRAFTPEGLEIQVGVMRYRGETTGAAQSEAIIALASHIQPPTSPVPPVELLPERVPLNSLTSDSDGTVIGISERDLLPIAIDLVSDPTFIVFGPDRSGRSTAAATITAGLQRIVTESYLLSGRRSPLADGFAWTGIGAGIVECEALVQALATKAGEWEQRTPTAPTLIVIEDGDDFKDGALAMTLEKLVQRARDLNVMVVATMTTFAGVKSYAPWVRLLRNNRHGLILQPDLEDDGDLFGIRLPQRSGLDLPVGRGLLVRRGGVELMQVAVGPTS